MTAAVRLRGVTKEFRLRGGTPQRALDDVSLDVEAGEIAGIIGRSGAGKSTLLRTVNGLEVPTSGEVLVGERDVTRLGAEQLRRQRQKIGMVFQQFNLWGSRTVYGNVAVPLKLAGWRDDAIARRVGELLDFVGLGDKAFTKPQRLSGGQKQRVGIARAIANRPEILLADEATSALDPQTTTEIVDLLRSVNAEFGITMLVVTHEMDVVARLARHVSIMSEGRIVETGEIHQVLSRPAHPETASLVGAYTHSGVDGAQRETLRAEFPGRRISVTAGNDIARTPVLSRLAREHGVDFTVVEGGIARVRNEPYGRLALALHGDDADIERFVSALAAHTEVTPW